MLRILPSNYKEYSDYDRVSNPLQRKPHKTA
jgi:hypothetical protein